MYVHTGFSFCCGCNSTTKCYTVANWKKRLVREKGKRGAARQGNILSRAAQDNFQDTCFERFVAPKKTKKKKWEITITTKMEKKKILDAALAPRIISGVPTDGQPLSGGPPILGVVSHHAQTVGTNENAPI